MRPKTALLIVLVALLILTPYFFIREVQNQELLLADFQVLGFQIKVLHTFALVTALALIMPSLYFTRLYLNLMRDKRGLVRAGKDAATAMPREALDLIDHGRLDEALELVGEPHDGRTRFIAAQAYLAKNEIATATGLLETAFSEDDHIRAGYLLAKTKQAQGQDPSATLQRMVDAYPKQAESAYRQLLEAHVRAERWTDCLALAEIMEEHGFPPDQDRRTAWRYASIVADENLSHKKRIESLQEVIRAQPDFVPANLALGEAYLLAGQVDKAVRLFEQGFESDGNPVYLEVLEAYFLDQGKPEDAIQTYRKLVSRQDAPMAQYKLGLLYYRLEMLDEALEMLEPLHGLFNKLHAYLVTIADIKRRRGRPDEALADLIVATEDHAEDHYLCANCDCEQETWVPRCPDCGAWGQVTHPGTRLTPTDIAVRPMYY